MNKFFITLMVVGVALSSCQSQKNQANTEQVKITLGAYTVPKEAYQKEIIPAFQKYWLEKTGQTVKFEESYIASGAQSRAIQAGFEADVAALSLEMDVESLKKAGIIRHNWKNRPYNGFITRSIVVIGFRPGNPKNIKDWEDLTVPGINVLYPSPKTSGGAMWDVNAIYGAGLKLSEAKTGTPNQDMARKLLKDIQRNVKVMDKSGRESVTTFENGFGDAIITYENEILLRQMQGRDFPFVIPGATILIENPIALLDAYVDKHKNREVVEAFIDFTYSRLAQAAFAKYGFRSVDEEVAAEYAQKYPNPEYLFDIGYLGGWDKVNQDIYGPNGVWTVVMQELGNEK